MPSLYSIKSSNFYDKRVLMRVDLNVPLCEGVVTDNTRILKVLPSIKYLLDQQAKIILMSHLGRPKGTGFEKEFSLAPVAKELSNILGIDVQLASDIVGNDAKKKSAALQRGEVLLLENLRFDCREKVNDPEFAWELSQLADVFVSDAFGTAHRSHASTVGVAQLLPSYAGFLLEEEVSTLNSMLKHPQKPFVAVLGGSKVSDKIGVIDALLDVCDTVIIGGAMCFTFLLAQGKTVGASLVEPDWVERSKKTLCDAKRKGVDILLPIDIVAADSFSEKAYTKICSVDAFDDAMMGLDIGPETERLYADYVKRAKTIFWNGPMGVFEMKPFESGTRTLTEAIISNKQAVSIIGGGDSVAAVTKFGSADGVSFISTGGGASMELLQAHVLPGVEALKR